MKVAKLKTRPNILVIITDQQRFDTLSCYGNNWIKTPNLDSLSKDSFIFENAYVTQPVCTPSRSSILTGLYPHTNGLIRNGISLNSETKTIAELIPDEYQKIYHGKWHLGDDSKPQHGFEKWITTHDPAKGENEISDYHKWAVSQGINFPEYYVRPGGDGSASEFAVFQANLPEEFTQASFIGNVTSKEILKFKENTEPFLLFANFFEPHPPYSGPLNGLYDPEKIPVGPAFLEKPRNVSDYNLSRAEHYIEGIHRTDSVASCDGYDLSDELGWRELRANYMSNVTLVDKNIGKILDALSESGQSENTIVVFTSDHGEMLGDHGMLEKRSFYEESSKVPLLIKVPWISKEQKFISGNISHVDLVPTLLDLINQNIPENVQGSSRKKVLLGQENLDSNNIFIQWNGLGDRDLGNELINKMNSISRRCIVSSDRWKLSVAESEDSSELFDLNSDPNELLNRIFDPSCKAKIALMKDAIKRWQLDTKDSVIL